MYFSARAEGRISYGHLGRTNSCSLCVVLCHFSFSYRYGVDNVDGFECSVCCRRFSTERGLKIHPTKSHKMDGDGFAVIVSGVPHVSRSNAVTSHNSHSQFNAMPATTVFCCAVCEQPFSTQQALSLHYFRKYEVRSVKDVKKLECRKNARSNIKTVKNVPWVKKSKKRFQHLWCRLLGRRCRSECLFVSRSLVTPRPTGYTCRTAQANEPMNGHIQLCVRRDVAAWQRRLVT